VTEAAAVTAADCHGFPALPVDRPERWSARNPTAFEFPVFQAGPRVCLGLNMVRLEGLR
jgi:hypothetical protein